MINKWKYAPFSELFKWCQKSNIGSREGNTTGLYPLYIASATEIKRYDSFLESGESLVFGTGGNPCVHYVTGKYAYTNHTEAAIKRDDSVFTKFFYYYFQKDRFSLLSSTFVGGGIKNSSKKKIGALLVPIVDIEEQKYIVARIEELFSQLESGEQTLRQIKTQLSVYRQAVLKEAFSHIALKAPIRGLTTLVTSGSRGWAQYYSETGALFIRIGNLTRTGIEIIFDDVQNVALPEKAEGIRSRLKPNDILVSITADLGSIGLVPSTIPEAYINQHIAVVRFKNPKQGKFMAWYLRSDWGQKELLKNKRGAGKMGLGLDDIRGTLVPVVSDDEASAILAQIESRLSVCDQIEQTVDAALQQAEALRQSILKKAFEGGL